MGESIEGSPEAARGAPDEGSDHFRKAVSFIDSLLRGRPRGDAAAPAAGGEAETAAARKGADDMLINIRRMRTMRVEDIAVPRADIVAVPDNATLDEVVAVFRDSAMTRVPVYSETLDNPVGLIHFKDLALQHGFGNAGAEFELQALLRPLLFAPPSMPIGVLLQKMQAARIHMALVIDEYGGVDGLATIEDVVEQIVGDIADEHDLDEGALWAEEAPDVYLAQSRAPLEEFEAAAGVDLGFDDLEDGDLETLGGLASMLAGRVPARGEVIVHPHGHELEVVDADPRRVKRLRVRLHRRGALDRAAE